MPIVRPKNQFDNKFLNLFDEIVQLKFEKMSAQIVKLSVYDWLLDKSDFLISFNEKNDSITTKDLSDKDLLIFSFRLRLSRLKNGLSQKQLANAVFVSPSSVGMYEQGRREPEFWLLLQICIILGTTTDYMLGVDKKIKPNLVEIDDVILEFVRNIKNNSRIVYNSHVIERNVRENFAASFSTALEFAKEHMIKCLDL